MRLRNRDLIFLAGLALIAALVIPAGLRLSGAWGATYSVPASCMATSGAVISSANWNSCLADIAGNGINKIDNSRVTANAAIAGSKLDLVSGTGRIVSAVATSVFPTLTLSDLTASLPVVTDGSKLLVSLAYTGSTSFRKNLGLETSDTPTFTGTLLSGLTASIPVVTDASKNLASVSYATFKSSLAITQADVSGLTTGSTPTFGGLGATPIVSSYAGPHAIGGAVDANTNLKIYGTLTNALWITGTKVRIDAPLVFPTDAGAGVAGPSIFMGGSGTAFVFSGGSSYTQWNNNANTVELMRLIDGGALALGTTYVAGSSTGDFVMKNRGTIRGVNAAGNGLIPMLTVENIGVSNDVVTLGVGGALTAISSDSIALGGGGTASLGSIGGSGPAAAGQYRWLKVVDTADGSLLFIPVWH